LRSDNRCLQHGYQYSWDYFADKYSQNLLKGPVRAVEVCCFGQQDMRAGIRSRDGAPEAFRAPLLPVNVQLASSKVSEVERGRRYEEDVSPAGRDQVCHGSSVVLLPSDYMCSSCQCRLRTCDLELASDADVAVWWQRLHMNPSFSGDRMTTLCDEQQRLRLRHEAMRHAAEDSNEAFEAFANIWENPLFEQASVSRHLQVQALAQPDAITFYGCYRSWSSNPKDQACEQFQRTFGIEKKGRGLWWAMPVPRHLSAPRCPSHPDVKDLDDSFPFTGRPGYCSPKLWSLRAFCVARGGFHKTIGLRKMLLQAEGEHDARYMTTVDGEHVQKFRPRGFPLHMWLALCRPDPDKAQSLAAAFFLEKESMGLHLLDPFDYGCAGHDMPGAMSIDAERFFNYLWPTALTEYIVPDGYDKYSQLFRDLDLFHWCQTKFTKVPKAFPRAVLRRGDVIWNCDRLDDQEAAMHFRLLDAAFELARPIAAQHAKRTLSGWKKALQLQSSKADALVQCRRLLQKLTPRFVSADCRAKLSELFEEFRWGEEELESFGINHGRVTKDNVSLFEQHLRKIMVPT